MFKQTELSMVLEPLVDPVSAENTMLSFQHFLCRAPGQKETP